MATQPTTITLRIERTLAAAPERVFDAWTQTEALARWFAPAKEFTTVVTQLDARPGGHFRWEMHSPDGKVFAPTGVFQEVTRPTRLVMTWHWEHQPADLVTLLTIELFPDRAGTRLVLTHERFNTEAEREEHNKGWTGCLAQLEAAMAIR